MRIQYGWPALAAVVLSGSVTWAQSPASTAPSVQKSESQESTVTLVGCIQREADYRKVHERGRGGVVGTGLGSGDEFVLINASPAAAAPGAVDCSSTASTEAYELTGSREGDLKAFVGRAVQITGTMKKAEVKPVGTAGSGDATQPTGGFDPLGQDLQLFEVNVTGVAEVGTLAQTAPGGPSVAEARRAPAPPPAASADTQAPAPATSAPAPATPAEARRTAQPLPDTASPLPLTALFGLLSLGSAAGLRLLRRG